MIEKGKIYEFKNEFCKELKIPLNQPNRRKEELLEWLKIFYDYELFGSVPIYIRIKEIYGDYIPLPRNLPKQDELNDLKRLLYFLYVIAELSTDFESTSKNKIAREAIEDFGRQLFGHTNARAVSSRFIKEPFDKYGETDNKWQWVYFHNYKPLDEEDLEEWYKILREEKITEKDMINAFTVAANDGDISEQISYYRKAVERFKDNHDGNLPVYVRGWRLGNNMSLERFKDILLNTEEKDNRIILEKIYNNDNSEVSGEISDKEKEKIIALARKHLDKIKKKTEMLRK